jgi:hypothetical protein
MECLEDYNQKIRGIQKQSKIVSGSHLFSCVKLFSLKYFSVHHKTVLRRNSFFAWGEHNSLLLQNRTGKYLNMNEKYFNLNMKWTDIMAHKQETKIL